MRPNTKEGKKEGRISTEAIIGIICGLIFIIVAVVFAVIICNRIKLKQKRNDNSTFAHKFNDYPSTASNIKT